MKWWPKKIRTPEERGDDVAEVIARDDITAEEIAAEILEARGIDSRKPSKAVVLLKQPVEIEPEPEPEPEPAEDLTTPIKYYDHVRHDHKQPKPLQLKYLTIRKVDGSWRVILHWIYPRWEFSFSYSLFGATAEYDGYYRAERGDKLIGAFPTFEVAMEYLSKCDHRIGLRSVDELPWSSPRANKGVSLL